MLAAYLVALSAVAAPGTAVAVDRDPNHVDFELGSGLAFRFDEGRHFVKLSAFIQPAWGLESVETELDSGETQRDIDQFLNARRTHLFLQGKFFRDTVEFFFQADFSQSEPLLDAFIGYDVTWWLNLSVGQRQAITNNRELLHQESQLTFSRRSLLSRTFSLSGRELGLFVKTDFDFAGVVLRPQLSVTSGDGRNSFGSDSRDVDLGGFKWGGRLDLLPLGDFTPGNRGMVVDLARERTLKIQLGGAFSYNDGASHRNGAGHGEFFLYDEAGDDQLPDYVMIYADLLAKFRGASLLVEFVNTSATSLQGTFTDDIGLNPLFRTQISELLVLGNGINAQLGYYFDFGLGVDVRYSQVFDEFTENQDSLLRDASSYGGNVAYYIKDQALKVQVSFEVVDVDGAQPIYGGDLLVQLIL